MLILPLIINTFNNSSSVINAAKVHRNIISEEDYRSLEETVYLSRSPKNLKRILEAKSRNSGIVLEDIKDAIGI